MGTVRKGREYGVCRCGLPIQSVGKVGTCWRHENWEQRCDDGRYPGEPNGAVTKLEAVGGRGTVTVATATRGVPEAGTAVWCQPSKRPRTAYRAAVIEKIDGDNVTLRPLTDEELGDRDTKWNLPTVTVLEAHWVKEKLI